MKMILIVVAIAVMNFATVSMAVTPTGENFNDTGDILARSKQHTNIEYDLSLIHISEPTRHAPLSRMPSSA